MRRATPRLAGRRAQRWNTSAGTGASYRRRLVAPPIVAGDTAYAMDALAG